MVEQHPLSNGKAKLERSALTDLGCWMDSATTRMVQSGIEHSRIPSTVPSMEEGKLNFPLLFWYTQPPVQLARHLVLVHSKN
jgi:hypothetical protein